MFFSFWSDWLFDLTTEMYQNYDIAWTRVCLSRAVQKTWYEPSRIENQTELRHKKLDFLNQFDNWTDFWFKKCCG